MTDFLIINARILTLAGNNSPRRKQEMNDLGIIELGHVLVKDGLIAHVGEGVPSEDLIGEDEDLPIVDAYGRVLMPTFVDCHTHSCWAGSRLEEFEMGLRGVPYLEILQQGGGIMSTVQAVRESSQEELTIDLLGRLGLMTSLGTTSMEVKSGYGLTTKDELKMLRAVHDASQDVPQLIVGTFLGAHAIDPDQKNFAEIVIHETLPAVV
ncbi:MAG: imidazolonepropionase, partial [Phycisphaerales bacterium]